MGCKSHIIPETEPIIERTEVKTTRTKKTRPKIAKKANRVRLRRLMVDESFDPELNPKTSRKSLAPQKTMLALIPIRILMANIRPKTHVKSMMEVSTSSMNNGI